MIAILRLAYDELGVPQMAQAMRETAVPEALRQRLAQSFFQTADWMRNKGI